MWVVMTKSAKMPGTVKHRYMRVAVVHVDDEYFRKNGEPKMISMRARGVIAIHHFGHHHVGMTARGAWQKAMADAHQLANQLNGAKLEVA